MKIRFLALSIMALLFLVTSESCESASRARLEVECGDTQDWGKVRPEQTPLNAKIKLFNRGEDTLIISKVKVGCGCTAAPLDRDSIEPGGYATLDVTLNPGQTPKVVHKIIELYTNDPNNEKFVLHLKCEIVTALTFFPNKFLGFGQITLDKESSYNIVITNTTNQDVFFKEIRFEPADMIVNIKENDSIKANNEFVLVAKLKPHRLGDINCKVSFKTTDPETAKVEILGKASVVPAGE
jgi:hypothetical protein